MNISERERRFSPITLLGILPVEEITLLRSVVQQFPDTLVEERESEGQEYRPMVTSATQLNYFNRTAVVPKGHERVAITTDPRNFPSIWHLFAEAKQNITQTPNSI